MKKEESGKRVYYLSTESEECRGILLEGRSSLPEVGGKRTKELEKEKSSKTTINTTSSSVVKRVLGNSGP